ncbi:MAG: SIS domain-containing protein [Deinococcales bacterium]
MRKIEARLPVEVEVASEFRYREPVVDDRTLCIVVSQSGETIDTLEGPSREAKRGGAKTLGIINVKGSSITQWMMSSIFMRSAEIALQVPRLIWPCWRLFELLAIWLGRKPSHPLRR